MLAGFIFSAHLKTVTSDVVDLMKSRSPPVFRVGTIGVPYNPGSKGINVEKGSEALRKTGIIARLKEFAEVIDFGDLRVALPVADCSNPKLLNPNQVKILCTALRDKIKLIAEAGYLPFILGGDCSLLMGAVEGLKSTTLKLGMVYMDAHGDFNTPDTTPSGIIGGMDVAIVTGRGPERLVNLFGHSPLLSDENIVLYGVRDLDPLEAVALAESKVKVYTRSDVRREGAESSVYEIISRFLKSCSGLYLHVDLDVIDESVFSASGLPVLDGLSREEFRTVVRGLVRSGKLCGVMLASFDAAKDADGSQATKLRDLVVESLHG